MSNGTAARGPQGSSLQHAKSAFSTTFCVRPSELFASEKTDGKPTRKSISNDRKSRIEPPPVGATAKADADSQTISVKLPFEVVTGQIPDAMLERLARDFSEEEVEQIYARCGRTMAPKLSPPERPAVLFVLGPSAVGKSYITDASASQLFGNAHNAVILDGEFFREWHAGWCEVVLHGMKQHILHQDAWSIFKDVKVPRRTPDGNEDATGKQVGISTALKQRILIGAVRDRQNLIVPSCANQPERLEQEMATLQQAGYDMHAVCLWAPRSETRQRGEPRSVREGKRWDGSSYEMSTKTIVEVAARWIADRQKKGDKSCYKSIALWDNTVFPAREVDLDEFRTLCAMTHEEADQHAWQCKKPKQGAAAWSRLRAAHSISKALKPKHAHRSTQTDIAVPLLGSRPALRAKGGGGGGGGGSGGSGGGVFSDILRRPVASAVLTSESEHVVELRAQRATGRREGALYCFVAASVAWGAACLTLALLLATAR